MSEVEESKQSLLVVGVNIAGGVAYLGYARCGPVLDLAITTTRIEPSGHLSDASQLQDFAERARQELRTLTPHTVGVAYPRLARNWQYAQAFTRIMVEAGIMLACVEEGIPFRQVKQEKAAKAVGVNIADVNAQMANRFGISQKPARWDHRGLAFMIAAAVAVDVCA